MSADAVTPVQGMSEKKDLTTTVAKHYNELTSPGLEQRVRSRIIFLRNFNNWMKSMAIAEAVKKIREKRGSEAELSVLDLCSGKGGDLLKWKKSRISRLVCADIAGTSVEQAADRYKEMVERNNRERHPSKIFTAEFITADCTKQRLKDMYKAPEPQFDIVSSQFSFHYSLESYEQTEVMLRNAAECLRPGGYFIGSTPNSYELIKRLRNSEGMSFGNEVYQVTFELEDKKNIPLFGAKYNFHLEGVVDCPEFLVYFPLMEKMAAKHGLKLVHQTPFADFFNQHIHTSEGRGLIGRMQALEGYPPAEDTTLVSSEPEAYKAAKEKVEKLKADQYHEHQRDDHRPKRITVGTLSKPEWEVETIYLAFAFQKVVENDYSSTDLLSGSDAAGFDTKRHVDDRTSDQRPEKLAKLD